VIFGGCCGRWQKKQQIYCLDFISCCLSRVSVSLVWIFHQCGDFDLVSVWSLAPCLPISKIIEEI
jgi:hypothetical protein